MQPNQNIPPVPPVAVAIPAPASSVTEGLPSSIPGYQEIVNQVLAELNKRKGILFKRVVLTVIPFLIGVIVLYMSSYIPSSGDGETVDIASPQTIAMIVGGVFLLIIGPIWAAITGRIFRTERIIWIDSFFDKVELDTTQSWAIAKKLFWPSVWLELAIFFRYYFIVIAVCIVLVVGGVVLSTQLDTEVRGWVILGTIFIPLIAAIIYTYLLNIRLRYIWFVFIDLYGTPEFSHAAIYARMNELNKRLNQEDFKKLITTTIGLDVVGAGANFALDGATSLMSKFGGPGKLIASITSIIGGSMIAVSKDYAKQVSYYMFYKLARQSLYGANDKGSTSLYTNNTTQL